MREHWLEMRYGPVVLNKNTFKQNKRFTLPAPKAQR